VPPSSGEHTTVCCQSDTFSFIHLSKRNLAVRQSTGMEKNPSVCGLWMSTVMTCWTPATSSIPAISLAAMGFLFSDFLWSPLAYGSRGSTAVIRRAPASLQACTKRRRPMRWLLVSLPLDCTMYTFFPRTESWMSTSDSPLT